MIILIPGNVLKQTLIPKETCLEMSRNYYRKCLQMDPSYRQKLPWNGSFHCWELCVRILFFPMLTLSKWTRQTTGNYPETGPIARDYLQMDSSQFRELAILKQMLSTSRNCPEMDPSQSRKLSWNGSFPLNPLQTSISNATIELDA
jgi:hypothetical protein